MTLENRMQERMKELGWRQAKLAKATGIDRSNVSHWYNGACKHIDPKYLHIVARALGVNEKWLNQGVGPKFPIDTMLGPKNLSQSEVEDYWLKMLVLCKELIADGIYPNDESSRSDLYFNAVEIMRSGNYPPLKTIEELLKHKALIKEK